MDVSMQAPCVGSSAYTELASPEGCAPVLLQRALLGSPTPIRETLRRTDVAHQGPLRAERAVSELEADAEDALTAA